MDAFRDLSTFVGILSIASLLSRLMLCAMFNVVSNLPMIRFVDGSRKAFMIFFNKEKTIMIRKNTIKVLSASLAIMCSLIFQVSTPQPQEFVEAKTIDIFKTVEPEEVPAEEQVEQEPVEEVIEEPIIEQEPLEGVPLYNSYIFEIAAQYNLDPYLMMSIVYHESTYNPYCVTGPCVGLMQVHTYWQTDRANQLGVYDLMDPYGNILTGCDIFADYYYNTGEDVIFALMMYNGGYGYAESMRSQGIVSEYASSVVARAEYYRSGGI